MNIKSLVGPALALFLAAPLAAQSARFGLSFNVAVPTGAFDSTTYPADSYVYSPTTERYNVGLGGQFTGTLPLDQSLAVRFGLGWQSFTGRATAPGYASINLRQENLSLGADLQLFLSGGSALRQSGTYLLVGAAVDFERFDSSYDDPYYWPDNTVNVSRMAGLVGVGHVFRGQGGLRYTLEGAYHRTLNQRDTLAGDPPPSDFVRLSFGVLF